MTSPRIIKSHFTGPLLPPQLWHKKPKILYILRNPKDLAVSMFHFQKIVLQVPEIINQSFAEFLDQMISGEMGYGPWWEHYLFFWKKRHESNVLLLRFEDTRRDLRGQVEKVSKFLGTDCSDEKLAAITDYCSFQNMKENQTTNPGFLFERKDRQNETFMRKGMIGEWKLHFTVAQNEVFTAHIKEKLYGTGLTFEND
ncbi:sulfotransferase 1E1-like [Asterias rubens]|uniref:sulfotransferase 1E1-like n=1 Tax=Asterias rubens TaxID=7604 RepID=UPI001454F06D|nr:sulfotransferase 1E1-like [Asterias rubens]